MTLADRLISGLRAREYGLERPAILDEREAYDWLMAYQAPDGQMVWRPDGDRARRRLARRWLWLRWLYRDRWIERGGRDA